MTDQSDKQYAPKKDLMGLLVVVLSFAVLILIIIIYACPGGSESNKDLLSIILPVVATWMGTVLAYYFSKENFTEANLRVREIMDQANIGGGGTAEVSVEDVMTVTERMTLITVRDMDDFRTRSLADVLARMKESNSDRIPILQSGTLRFLFHIYRSTIVEFIHGYRGGEVMLKGQQSEESRKAEDGLTVADMFDSDFKLIRDIMSMTDASFFLSADATLKDVRELMAEHPLCQDVFITESGKADGAVLGWITNNDVVEATGMFRKPGNRHH